MAATEPTSSDAELMRRVADGSGEALALLHRRFARLIRRVAVPTLDRAAADDLVQDVFLAVWQNAARFDAARGSVRAWMLQIAHYRLLNELRRRSRQPEFVPDGLDGARAGDLGPAETASRRERRALLTAAFDDLTEAQRQAIDLAFFDDLSHEQVAVELGVPLGTAKTRIRAGIQRLRGTLGPQWAALAALCVAAAIGLRYRAEHATLARYDRALSMVTASDAVNLRLGAGPGVPEETHARYRARPAAGIAVVTLSNFPPAPAGMTYQAWLRRGDTWTSLGTAEPDAARSARLIAEAENLTTAPDGLQVTLEPRRGSGAPSGRVIVSWTP